LDFFNSVEVVSSISLWSLDSLEFLSKFYSTQPLNIHISGCPLLQSINLTRGEYNSVSLQNPDLEIFANENTSIEFLSLSYNVKLHPQNKIDINQIWLQNATSYTSFASLVADFNLDTLTTLLIAGYDHFSSKGFPDSMFCKNFSLEGIKNLNYSGFENKQAFLIECL